MKYLWFEIENYRAIKEPIRIDFRKTSLVPVIGVNECGKTTILQALIALDCFNDELMEGRHLKDVGNLYVSSPPDATVTAAIELDKDDIVEVLQDLMEEAEYANNEGFKKFAKGRTKFSGQIRITRNLTTKTYTIEDVPSLTNRCSASDMDAVASALLRELPYILYFDDFQDSIPGRIEIVKGKPENADWRAIFQTLFRKTDSSFSIYDLSTKDERRRKAILSKVERTLNETLIDEWQNFRLDDSDALRISIDYEEEKHQAETRCYLKFDVVETDKNGDSHFFFVRDRSKGFYWFFNFVMKLEFNAKVAGGDGIEAIYVLDEPGSYLHALAQERLCKKLRLLSERNHVVYCTHSHHLLNPETIPLSCVRIANKDTNGSVSLTPIYEHRGNITERRSAYQPLLDALQIRPFAVDISHDRVVIVEGIIDYYLLELFKGSRSTRFFPSVGANSIKFYISIMIAWQIPYRSLWDNDAEGRKARNDAEMHFGKDEANSHFYLLPLHGASAKNRIIQDLVDGSDLRAIRQRLGINQDASFDKIISTLFFHDTRKEIVGSLSRKTLENFDEVFQLIAFETN